MKRGNIKRLPKWVLNTIQCLLVAVYLLVAVFAVHGLLSKLAVASLAASAFIAFGFPAAESARAKYLLGGYGCAVGSGVVCGYARQWLLGSQAGDPRVLIGFGVLAVFFTSLLMIFLNLQHPPSCALTVGIVLEPQPLVMGLAMLGCMAVLCLMRWAVMRVYLKYYAAAETE